MNVIISYKRSNKQTIISLLHTGKHTQTKWNLVCLEDTELLRKIDKYIDFSVIMEKVNPSHHKAANLSEWEDIGAKANLE